MPRQDVPYGGAICRLKERIAEIWDKLDEKLHSINGVEGDGAGNVEIASGDAAVLITNDQVGHRIKVALDKSKLPAATVSSVNGQTGAVRLDAVNILSDGDSNVQADIDLNKAAINDCFDSITSEQDDRKAADDTLQTNINAVSANIPEMSITPDPYKGVERDAQGRSFAADPAAGATDKTLVTANWVSQTGSGKPNNVLHDTGNETKSGTLTLLDPIYGRLISPLYEAYSGALPSDKYRIFARIPASYTDTMIVLDAMVSSNGKNFGYGRMIIGNPTTTNWFCRWVIRKSDGFLSATSIQIAREIATGDLVILALNPTYTGLAISLVYSKEGPSIHGAVRVTKVTSSADYTLDGSDADLENIIPGSDMYPGSTDVAGKLDKISSGSTLKAYTHTGQNQGETSVVNGIDANSIGLRDANGRMQAADPAAGATDKTLVTANWVSQTGDGAPNNLIHKNGNETKLGILNLPDGYEGIMRQHAINTNNTADNIWRLGFSLTMNNNEILIIKVFSAFNNTDTQEAIIKIVKVDGYVGCQVVESSGTTAEMASAKNYVTTVDGNTVSFYTLKRRKYTNLYCVTLFYGEYGFIKKLPDIVYSNTDSADPSTETHDLIAIGGNVPYHNLE